MRRRFCFHIKNKKAQNNKSFFWVRISLGLSDMLWFGDSGQLQRYLCHWYVNSMVAVFRCVLTDVCFLSSNPVVCYILVPRTALFSLGHIETNAVPSPVESLAFKKECLLECSWIFLLMKWLRDFQQVIRKSLLKNYYCCHFMFVSAAC